MRLASIAPVVIPAFASSFVPARIVPFIPHLCPSGWDTPPCTVVAKANLPAYARPVVPAKLLHGLVEDKAQTRVDVVRAVSAYVKEHKLQDPKDGRVFYCDDVLKSALGVEKCTFLQVQKHLSPHLIKPEELGGRYLDEASAIEHAFRAQRPTDDGPKRKGRSKSEARKIGAQADKKAGKNIYQPMILSDELAAVCREPELRRHEVIRAVWKYIRMNNLKGQGPPENPIKCDFLLRKVFDADNINVRTVMSGISPHMRKKDPFTEEFNSYADAPPP